MDDWLNRTARAAPDTPALIDGRGTVTHAALDEAATRAARRLAALGVREGDRVATTLPAGRDLAALTHGAPRAGAVLAPLNTRLPEAEIRRQGEIAGARIVVSEPLEGEEADVEPRLVHDPAAPHTLLFTSGSTAAPKPVTLTFANHSASAAASAGRVPLGPEDRWLCVVPLFHIAGLAILFRCAIAGAAAVLHERFDAASAAAALERGDCTVVSLVPTMLRRMVAEGLSGAPGLRAAVLGGGPVPRDLLEWGRASGVPVLATYGMTETASQVATGEPWEPAVAPLPGAEIRIADDGEILVRGEMVAPGTAAEDGWLRTGDLGELDGSGRLVVKGRKKDVIVTGGENVAAAEVEEALLAHPAVTDAGVAARPDPEWGEVVVAHVVLGAEVGDAELEEHCRSRLAGFKVPRAYVRHPELPRNATGKLLRGLLE